jgi:hypothetical protein
VDATGDDKARYAAAVPDMHRRIEVWGQDDDDLFVFIENSDTEMQLIVSQVLEDVLKFVECRDEVGEISVASVHPSASES